MNTSVRNRRSSARAQKSSGQTSSKPHLPSCSSAEPGLNQTTLFTNPPDSSFAEGILESNSVSSSQSQEPDAITSDSIWSRWFTIFSKLEQLLCEFISQNPIFLLLMLFILLPFFSPLLIGLSGRTQPSDLFSTATSPHPDSRFSFESTVDFIADTGDGYLTTFSVFRVAHHPGFHLSTHGEQLYFPRAQQLILGGDLVYPYPTRQEFRSRFLSPFYASMSETPIFLDSHKLPRMVDWMHPEVLFHAGQRDYLQKIFGISSFRSIDLDFKDRSHWATNPPQAKDLPSLNQSDRKIWVIPGNHDVLDGGEVLNFFFYEKERLGDYYIPQNLPYFIFSPYKGWVFLGIHNQHSAGADPDIDLHQLVYFKDALKSYQNCSAVIFMHAPIWLLPTSAEPSRFTQLLDECALRSISIRMIVAGDLHLYARYEDSSISLNESLALLISGGGGAFTHSAHMLPKNIHFDPLRRNFTLVSSFPDRFESLRLSLGLLFLVFQWPILFTGLIMALIFSMLLWALDNMTQLVDITPTFKIMSFFFLVTALNWTYPLEYELLGALVAALFGFSLSIDPTVLDKNSYIFIVFVFLFFSFSFSLSFIIVVSLFMLCVVVLLLRFFAGEIPPFASSGLYISYSLVMIELYGMPPTVLLVYLVFGLIYLTISKIIRWRTFFDHVSDPRVIHPWNPLVRCLLCLIFILLLFNWIGSQLWSEIQQFIETDLPWYSYFRSRMPTLSSVILGLILLSAGKYLFAQEDPQSDPLHDSRTKFQKTICYFLDWFIEKLIVSFQFALLLCQLLFLLHLFQISSEQFSFLQNEGFKSFVRFSFDTSGTMFVLPIGISQPLDLTSNTSILSSIQMKCSCIEHKILKLPLSQNRIDVIDIIQPPRVEEAILSWHIVAFILFIIVSVCCYPYYMNLIRDGKRRHLEHSSNLSSLQRESLHPLPSNLMVGHEHSSPTISAASQTPVDLQNLLKVWISKLTVQELRSLLAAQQIHQSKSKELRKAGLVELVAAHYFRERSWDQFKADVFSIGRQLEDIDLVVVS